MYWHGKKKKKKTAPMHGGRLTHTTLLLGCHAIHFAEKNGVINMW